MNSIAHITHPRISSRLPHCGMDKMRLSYLVSPNGADCLESSSKTQCYRESPPSPFGSVECKALEVPGRCEAFCVAPVAQIGQPSSLDSSKQFRERLRVTTDASGKLENFGQWENKEPQLFSSSEQHYDGRVQAQNTQSQFAVVHQSNYDRRSFDMRETQSAFSIGTRNVSAESAQRTRASREAISRDEQTMALLRRDPRRSHGVNKAYRIHACYCGRSFNKREHLKRHKLLVHEEIRPYKCEICDVHFGTKQNYQVHLSTQKHEQRTANCKKRRSHQDRE